MSGVARRRKKLINWISFVPTSHDFDAVTRDAVVGVGGICVFS